MRQYYFVFCKDGLLLQRQPDGTCTIPLQEEPPTEVKPWTTILNVSPMADGTPVKAYSVDLLTTGETIPLRQSYYHLPQELYLKAGKCAELLYWDHNTRFCGVCGGPMRLHTDISKRCEHCGKEVWPQLATAIIVLIHRGPDEILMARARNFRGDFYGLIAGFVETGETLEEAVHREVSEETGLTVANVRYFGSQPWPYPSGLMVGYEADYAGGQLHVQREELKNVAWFHRDHLPKLPEKLSIARQLIDHWLGEG
ncbi:MAG: NAD(+) diphosphatase [Prevotella sp.]|nr:NAD(+) diphosphatase [Prevotella sp.]MBR1934279.1 NAD(+) diphosphatase [Prevotella sp.]